MKAICKKKCFRHYKWGNQYTFSIDAERTAKGLTIYFNYNNSHWITVNNFLKHFVLLERSKFKKFIIEWKFILPDEKILLLKSFGFDNDC